MIFVPYADMKRSAEALEQIDRLQCIRSCRDWILEDSEILETPVLARYGLVLLNTYRATTGKEPVKQAFFTAHLRGNPEFPPIEHRNHRSMLALLGWTRYYIERGYEPEEMATLVTKHKDGRSLQATFESMLKDDDGSSRSYQFDELPGAPPLWPYSL